jgi:tetratricopeptide (TPR) repeat protein
MQKSYVHHQQAPNNLGRAQRPEAASLASLFAEGLARHRAGQLADAEAIYHQVLASKPDHFDSLHLLGVIFLQRGNPAKAVQQIGLALKKEPNNIDALNNRGNALNDLKRFDEALASFDRALGLRPDHAETHSNRGNALKELERFEEALGSYDRALALRPDYAEALSNRGNVLNALRRFDEALASCERALVLRPHFAQAHSNRGNALKQLKRRDEALASYDRALAAQPDYAEAHSNRGNVLDDLGRHEEALASYDRALALRPDFADAHCNRGNALQNLKRLDEAVESYDRALVLRPDFAEALSNRGNPLVEMRRFDDALASFDRAIALRGDFGDAHFNAAVCRLLIGDFADGWREYEWRWETEQLRDEKRSFARPQWLGSDAIAGKTILVHAEQGFGDTIQFCRYVPLVASYGARVILEVPRPLRTLMGALAGTAHVVARGDDLPDFDQHCPLLSLPLAFGTRLETIPAATPYLSAPSDKTLAWRERLGQHQRPRVGLAWAGNPRKDMPNAARLDRQRSITFDRLAPALAITECDFYSLQKGEDAIAQLRASAWHRRVIDWTEDLHDFADTAALIENLDLVIAVDTSVAHLAGALGKPFWLLNRYNNCWRWLLEREDSPWYPGARLFRQDQTREWDPAIRDVAAALREYVRSWQVAASL